MVNPLDELVDANRRLFLDLDSLLAGLTDALYVTPADPCYHSTVGQQTRHIIEHGEALVDAPASGIDFHTRARDTATEQSVEHARARLGRLIERLDALAEREDPDRAVAVRHVLEAGATTEEVSLTSTLGRELTFLQSHSTHHMALIGVMAALHGVAVPAGFGVAPSTRRYWAARAGTATATG